MDVETVRGVLLGELLAWMREPLGAGIGADGDDRFTRMALRVFAFQFAANAPYRRYCERRGVRPEDLHTWRDIPVVATDAFKEVPLTCFPPEQAAAVFVTSGTTRQVVRGKHYLRSLDLYHASLLPAFAARLLPDGARLPAVILGFSPDTMPQSSLSHMFGVVVDALCAQRAGAPDGGGASDRATVQGRVSPNGPPRPGAATAAPASASSSPLARIPSSLGPRGDGSTYFLGPGGVDVEGATARLAALAGQGQPVLLMGTAFAFVHLLDHMAERGLRLRLPAGSRIMDTGGYKGRSRELPKSELYALYRGVLGVPDDHIVNEYGMTEMCSQFYDDVLSRHHRDRSRLRASQDGAASAAAESGDNSTAAAAVVAGGPRHKVSPPWVRTVVVDPETLDPLPPGAVGVLRHYDLANLDSVIALQTADLGIAGAGGFEIIGRAAGAEARGCSLAVEELLEAQR